jgi:uncharacterized protein with HEPN domain
MTREAAKLLWDARLAADRVARITANRSFEDYLADEILRWAVERQLTIIGEALSGLRRVDSPMAGNIPDLARIVAFRNVLIHGYAVVDDRLVWGVIERNLDQLRTVLATLLKDAPVQDPDIDNS